MKLLMFAILVSHFLGVTGYAATQKQADPPTQTVIKFYQALRAKQYIEGFRRSVYREAIEGLTPEELQDLEPDFSRTFSAIPDKIEPKGEQITGESAVVSLKFDGLEEIQKVELVRVTGEWLVGDSESLSLVKAQGRSFFFNARIQVNESEASEILTRIIGAQIIYSQRFDGRNAPFEELVRLGALPKDLESGEGSGYNFSLRLTDDQKSFSVLAIPRAYGRTGRLSFYADINGIRAEDLQGKDASAGSPVYRPN